jgi:Zn-dependent peptidase ImmA (M78 family)
MFSDQTHLKDATLSVLARVRELTPKDIWDVKAMEQNSEKQAKLLRRLLGVKTPVFPNEAIAELPRIKVEVDDNLSYSAAAYWDGLNWVIKLNGFENPLRQRFSLGHEIKHIIDHPTKYSLYLDFVGIRHNNKAEHQADYFSACLLMPREHVIRLYKMGITGPTELAKYFQVSPRAMHIRMHQLKLTTRWQRCKLRVKHKVFVMRILVKVWSLLPFPEGFKV